MSHPVPASNHPDAPARLSGSETAGGVAAAPSASDALAGLRVDPAAVGALSADEADAALAAAYRALPGAEVVRGEDLVGAPRLWSDGPAAGGHPELAEDRVPVIDVDLGVLDPSGWFDPAAAAEPETDMGTGASVDAPVGVQGGAAGEA